MKVQHLSLGFSWPAPEQQAIPSSPSSSSSLSSSSSSTTTTTTNHQKRLRSLVPKLSISTPAAASPEFMSAKFASTRNLDSSLMQSGGSGTRWNPMPEQIKVLEALYQGGMRTPNPTQIERITAELGRYGRIEGKNVFYWFQNHKARERQKQKRSAALLALAVANNTYPPSTNHKVQLQKEETKTMTIAAMATTTTTKKKKKKKKERESSEDGSGCCKRKRRSWGSAGDESGGATDRTLELFPLRPEWKQMG